MTTIPTISELLQLSGSQYRIFDIGRRIDKISKEQFTKIELNQQAYPFPSQGHAFIAIVFWQKKSNEPYLWFVKLPLDERGLLNQGARNHFIAIIVEALGSDLTVDATEQQEALLKKNPYNFTAAQYKLASLNSIISAELKHPVSTHYQHCLTYMTGKLSWNSWQQVGVQGIADFAARIDEADNTQTLINALPHLPEQVLSPLCSALENQKLNAELISVIIENILLAQQKGESFINFIRALSTSSQHPYVEQLVDKIFIDEPLTEELIIVLTGRCWEVFIQEKRLMTFLELIIAKQDQQLFSAIFKDLVAIPLLRPILFQCMRSPNRSNDLAKAIGKLFQST